MNNSNLRYVGFGTVYAGYVSNNDRGTNLQCVGLFDTQHNAKISVEGKSYYGANGTVKNERAILFTDADDNKYAFLIGVGAEVSRISTVDREKQLAMQREAALSKLTPKERELLGLT